MKQQTEIINLHEHLNQGEYTNESSLLTKQDVLATKEDLRKSFRQIRTVFIIGSIITIILMAGLFFIIK